MSMRQHCVQWYLSMELALCYCSGALNSEVASRFLETPCTPNVKCSNIKCQVIRNWDQSSLLSLSKLDSPIS